MSQPRQLLFAAAVAVALAAASVAYAATTPHAIADGPFKPTWESLATGYQCPDWFRDAKFGIWAHWTAQCVPEQGDWYARNMYVQGDADYDYQVSHYGHPSKSGFMELDNLWKAEHWEPEKLMALYKAAGAKYFFALANHHDNFDNYDSTYHNWNSTRVGPKTDIVGRWEKAARAAGLRFGVSNHSAHTWHWFQTAYGYDPVGPLAGVRYDAFHLTQADGHGKWWDGLDPQDLYGGRHLVPPDGITSIQAMNDWHSKNDGLWHEEPPPNDPAYADNWYLRCKDLLDKYHPDQIYFDDSSLPLGQTGLDIAAHFYNSSLAYNGGKMDVVINAKGLPPEHRPALVEDYERGVSDSILPAPWQTDTCIGSWHYDRRIFERHQYKTVEQVTQMLVDIVSKNGNLMLSVPIKADGTLDADELAFLHKMADWTAANGEGIFGSRPWHVYGEGASKVASSMFNEGKLGYGADDIRFTTKGDALYVYILGTPKGAVTVTSLATGAAFAKPIGHVALLGSSEPVSWQQTQAGLVVQKPMRLTGDGVIGFKVTFK